MCPRSTIWGEQLAAARAGSAAAVGRLLESGRPCLLAIAAAELDVDLRAKADAADLVQETLLEALQDFRRFDGDRPEQWQSWLRTMLLHNVANFRRHYRDTVRRDVARERPLPVPWPGAVPGEGLANDDSTPSGKAARREEHDRLHQAVARLPGHYRDVIVWHVQEHRSFAEIGQRLGRSADAAKQMWLRALRRLGDELQGQR